MRFNPALTFFKLRNEQLIDSLPAQSDAAAFFFFMKLGCCFHSLDIAGAEEIFWCGGLNTNLSPLCPNILLNYHWLVFKSPRRAPLIVFFFLV